DVQGIAGLRPDDIVAEQHVGGGAGEADAVPLRREDGVVDDLSTVTGGQDSLHGVAVDDVVAHLHAVGCRYAGLVAVNAVETHDRSRARTGRGGGDAGGVVVDVVGERPVGRAECAGAAHAGVVFVDLISENVGVG